MSSDCSPSQQKQPAPRRRQLCWDALRRNITITCSTHHAGLWLEQDSGGPTWMKNAQVRGGLRPGMAIDVSSGIYPSLSSIIAAPTVQGGRPPCRSRGSKILFPGDWQSGSGTQNGIRIIAVNMIDLLPMTCYRPPRSSRFLSLLQFEHHTNFQGSKFHRRIIQTTGPLVQSAVGCAALYTLDSYRFQTFATVESLARGYNTQQVCQTAWVNTIA